MSINVIKSLLLGYSFTGVGFYLLGKQILVMAIICFFIAMWHFVDASLQQKGDN